MLIKRELIFTFALAKSECFKPFLFAPVSRLNSLFSFGHGLLYNCTYDVRPINSFVSDV